MISEGIRGSSKYVLKHHANETKSDSNRKNDEYSGHLFHVQLFPSRRLTAWTLEKYITCYWQGFVNNNLQQFPWKYLFQTTLLTLFFLVIKT